MAGFLVLLLIAASSPAAPPPLDRARELFNRTRYEEALKLLLPVAPKDGEAWWLLGRCHYMRGDFKKASEAFEKAVASELANSVYHNWLGKAYGRRAETANPFSAPGLASKARRSFEKAVQLNPRNIEAVNDLFEYYLHAPGFLGGGLDKAVLLAEKIRAADPAEYHYAMAQLAEKRKEFKTAEEQLRRAVCLAPQQAGRIIDLARFLAKQGRLAESEAAFDEAAAIAPDNPRVLFERANAYLRNKKNLDTARALLKRYLESELTPDDPPRSEAERLLREASGG